MADVAGVRLAELAQWAGVELRGDPDARVDRVATLEGAGPGAVTFLANPRYRRYLGATQATAVVLHPDEAEHCPVAALLSTNPYLSFARIAAYLNPPPAVEPGVHPAAWVHPDAVLDEGVSVDAQAAVHAGARIGAGTRVGSGTVVEAGAVIGRDCRIAANVTIGTGVVVGDRVVIHAGAVLGADGFGFANDKGRWVKVPQIGSVRIGDDVEIGACTCIDRGALGDTVVEEGVKLDNQIQVGHNVRIGAHTAIAAATAIAGSTTIGKRCTIGGAVAMAGHLTIVDGAVITGMTAVSRSITEPGIYSSGTQMVDNHTWRKSAVRFNHLDEMYRRLRELETELAAVKAQLKKDP